MYGRRIISGRLEEDLPSFTRLEKHYEHDQIKEGEMDGACSTNERGEKFKQWKVASHE